MKIGDLDTANRLVAEIGHLESLSQRMTIHMQSDGSPSLVREQIREAIRHYDEIFTAVYQTVKIEIDRMKEERERKLEALGVEVTS